MKEIHEMDVYRLAENLSDMVWDAYDSWDFKAQKTVGLQIIRASDSIAANIAEGFGRYNHADKKRFYRYARGSFEETKAWLRKAFRRGLISSNTEIESFTRVIDELGLKLNAFIKNTGT